MPNINKYGVGRLMKAQLPNGKWVERQDQLLYKTTMEINDGITFLRCVPDDDHFLFQVHTPVPESELIGKYGGTLPLYMRGPLIRCTCGADAIVFVDGPYTNWLCCRHFAMFGNHQTSEKIVDGKMILSKNSAKWLYDGNQLDEFKDKLVKRDYLK
jgi:hypothetical protein